MKDLGAVGFILGMEIVRDRKTGKLGINPSSLRIFYMENSKNVDTLLDVK